MLYFYKNDEDLILFLTERNMKGRFGWQSAGNDFGIDMNDLLFYNGVPVYKYADGKAVLRSEEEMSQSWAFVIS